MNGDGVFVGWLDLGSFVLLLVVIAYMGYRVLRWLISRQYAPQRFAFRALGVLSAGFVALVGLYSIRQLPVQFFRVVIGDSEAELEAPALSSAELALLVLAYGILAAALFSFFYFLIRTQQPARGEPSEPHEAPGLAEEPKAFVPQAPGTSPERLGHVLARHLIMADDKNYGLSDPSSLTLESVQTGQRDGWHPEVHAFLGRYGVAEEPYVYFYYETASAFLAHGAIDSWRQRYSDRLARLIVEEATAGERARIEEAGIAVKTFAEICEQPEHLLIYRRWLKNRMDEPAAGGIGPKISECYVPLAGEFRDGDSTQPVPDVISWLLRWVTHETSEQVSFLGEYGQGKSVVALKFATELLERFHVYRRVPILIELGGKSPRNMAPMDLVRLWAQRFSIDPNLAQYWIEEGRAVLVFDAFDEMDLVGDRNVVEQHFHALWRFAEGYRPKVLITGRSNLFLGEDEMAPALRARGHRGSAGEYSRLLYVRKLDRAQIRDALRAWPPDTASGLLRTYDDAGEHSEFRDLVSRPSMLVQAAAIWPDIRDIIGKETASTALVMRTFLYETFKRKRQTRQGTADRGEAPVPLLTLGELSFFMRAIALWMVQNTGQTNRINREDVAQQIRRLLQRFPQSLPRNLDPTFAILPSVRREVYLPRYLEGHADYGPDVVIREVIATGVLVDDPTDLSQFRMAHKSFLEYFIAECFLLYNFPRYFGSEHEVAALKRTFNIKFENANMTPDIMLQAVGILRHIKKAREYAVSRNHAANFILGHQQTITRGAAVCCGVAWFVGIPLFAIAIGPWAAVSSLGAGMSSGGLAVVIEDFHLQFRNSVRLWLHYNILSRSSWSEIVRLISRGTVESELFQDCDVLVINQKLVARISPMEQYLTYLRDKILELMGRRVGANRLNRYAGPGTDPSVARVEIRGPGWFDYGSGQIQIPDGQKYRIAIYNFKDRLP